MKASTFALLSVIGNAAAQGVTAQISPSAAAPAGCQPTLSSNFEITVLSVQQKRELSTLQKRATCSDNGVLVAALSDGVIKDSKGRTGYIASNYQFQFDGPPQAGAIYTAGFSVCGNGSLALGGSTVFYECQSGDFYNLYDRSWAAQCSPVEIAVSPCDGIDPPGDASQSPDGQVVGTQVITTTVVVPISDGQPQVITTTVPIPLCQISDGQLQAHTTPCASITSTVAPATTSAVAPVSQYSDGQIQVTPVTGGGAPTPGTTVSATATASASASASASAGTVPPVVISGSGTTVVVPTETLPSIVGSGSTSVVGPSSPASNTTLSTTASPSPSTSGGATTSGSGPTTTTTSAPASGAGSIEMSSLAALVVGLCALVFGL